MSFKVRYNNGQIFLVTDQAGNPLVRNTETGNTTTTPSAPTGVSGTAGDSQVSLSWTSPASNGGSTITDYVVQYSSNSGSSWTTFSDGTSTSTSATVTGLTNGTAYVFRVAAVNSVGTGSYSTASSSVTPAAPWPQRFCSNSTAISPTRRQRDARSRPMARQHRLLPLAPTNTVPARWPRQAAATSPTTPWRMLFPRTRWELAIGLPSAGCISPPRGKTTLEFSAWTPPTHQREDC